MNGLWFNGLTKVANLQAHVAFKEGLDAQSRQAFHGFQLRHWMSVVVDDRLQGMVVVVVVNGRHNLVNVIAMVSMMNVKAALDDFSLQCCYVLLRLNYNSMHHTAITVIIT